MRCRFGKNVRLVMPVVLRPTPPKYFALPRRVIWLPITGFLPQTAHSWPMSVALDPVAEGVSAERESIAAGDGLTSGDAVPVSPRTQGALERSAPSGRGETGTLKLPSFFTAVGLDRRSLFELLEGHLAAA